MTLIGKVALVTGGSGGIGRACCLALAAEGMLVAVGYRADPEAGADVAASCPDGRAVHLDVRSAESVAQSFREVEQSVGPVDVLVNAAGVTRDHPLVRMREADWADVIDTNLSGVFRCTKAALPGMIRRRWGRVVTIGSVVGELGNPFQSGYAAAKAGLVAFTKSVAAEVGRYEITLNVVSPGYVETAMTAALPDAVKAQILERVPSRRAGTADEVAQAVLFCLRSGYMTGSVIFMDGGLVPAVQRI